MVPGVLAETCDLATVGARNPTEGWREVLARTYIPFDAYPDPAPGEVFDVQASLLRLGDLRLLDYACGRGLGVRRRREIAATDGDVLGFMVMREGRVGLTLNGSSMMLASGQAAIWDGARQGSFTAVEPIVKRTLIVPRDRLRAAIPGYEGAIGRPLGEGTTALKLMAGYLDSLVSLAPGLKVSARIAAADAALELLRAVLGEALPSDSVALRMLLLSEVPRYVEAHLADAGLGPAMIARAHAVSVRTLHQAFESTGESVCALIRRRRLQRCYEDLIGSPRDSVTTIALRWGFQSASHFSRAFRRQFGASPSELRAMR
ncbi:MAG TPA: helix-turn-helix domain-containing protein [Solirubrobacteraceae bacterium]|nr:helix-turn-helix domain-containing protein [Solirubrobacteraceae bacterium]